MGPGTTCSRVPHTENRTTETATPERPQYQRTWAPHRRDPSTSGMAVRLPLGLSGRPGLATYVQQTYRSDSIRTVAQLEAEPTISTNVPLRRIMPSIRDHLRASVWCFIVFVLSCCRRKVRRKTFVENHDDEDSSPPTNPLNPPSVIGSPPDGSISTPVIWTSTIELDPFLRGMVEARERLAQDLEAFLVDPRTRSRKCSKSIYNLIQAWGKMKGPDSSSARSSAGDPGIGR